LEVVVEAQDILDLLQQEAAAEVLHKRLLVKLLVLRLLQVAAAAALVA
jgi:hypothetical protein